MSSEKNLKKLFQNWNLLNEKVQGLFGLLDFSKIKPIRKKQKDIEDAIYEILKDSAPQDIKDFLPEGCGDMEVGFEKEGFMFYFVMIDPESEDSDEIKLMAITIDTENNVGIVKDFEIE